MLSLTPAVLFPAHRLRPLPCLAASTRTFSSLALASCGRIVGRCLCVAARWGRVADDPFEMILSVRIASFRPPGAGCRIDRQGPVKERPRVASISLRRVHGFYALFQ